MHRAVLGAAGTQIADRLRGTVHRIRQQPGRGVVTQLVKRPAVGHQRPAAGQTHAAYHLAAVDARFGDHVGEFPQQTAVAHGESELLQNRRSGVGERAAPVHDIGVVAHVERIDPKIDREATGLAVRCQERFVRVQKRELAGAVEARGGVPDARFALETRAVDANGVAPHPIAEIVVEVGVQIQRRVAVVSLVGDRQVLAALPAGAKGDILDALHDVPPRPTAELDG